MSVTETMIGDIFATDGPLAQLNPKYQRREGQVMASEVIYQTMRERRMSLVEAPTGTGKSIAYLVPAFKEAAAGRRTIISTHTKGLQEQLLLKDIPLMRKLFGDSVQVSLLKGRGNYLCMHEYEELDQEPARRNMEPWRRLTNAVYSDDNDWDGDYASLDFVYPNWQEVASTKDSCTGKKCRLYNSCHYYYSRKVAKQAGIIIVNHALALQDAVLKEQGFPGLLPPYSHIVFDEAHHIAEVADGCVGVEWSNRRIQRLIRRLGKLTIQVASPEELVFLGEQNENLFASFGDIPQQALELAIALDDPRRDKVLESYVAVSATLQTLAERMRLELPPEDDEEVKLTGDQHKLRSALNTLERIQGEGWSLLEKTQEDTLVRYVERDNDSPHMTLRATHLDPAAMLADTLWKPLKDKQASATFVSATLATDKGFAFPKGTMGLNQYASLTAQVDSPFDFEKNALIYVPQHLPEPPSPKAKGYPSLIADYRAAQAEEMLRLCQMTDGRAFLLFTSFESMLVAHNAMKGNGFQLFVQREETPRVLLDKFVKSTRGVLLGVATFWEGVDVQGDDLSLVVIDRIPFASHDHPLRRARERELVAHGGNPFNDLSIPEAQIKLKQGVGRLIRTVTDRGVVAILDKRLITKPYGKRFMNSLPPAQKAFSMTKVEQFWSGKKEEPTFAY